MSSTNYAVSIIVILILGLIVKESAISDSIKIILCTMMGLVAYIALNIDNTEKFAVVRRKWITTQMILDMIDSKIAALPTRSDYGSTKISNIQIDSMINSKLESLPAYGLTSVEISSIRTLLSAYLSGSMATSRPSLGSGSSSGSSDGSSSGYASSQPASQSLTSLANMTEDYIENLKKLARLNETKINNLLALSGITSDTAMSSEQVANLKALAGISALSTNEATNLKALASITALTAPEAANLKALAGITAVDNLKALSGWTSAQTASLTALSGWTPAQITKLTGLVTPPTMVGGASKAIQLPDNMKPGTVVIWSGLATEIPDGWAACDGRIYTGSDGKKIYVPDLRGRFVLGENTQQITKDSKVTRSEYKMEYDNSKEDKNEYGRESVILDISNIPAHKHWVGKIRSVQGWTEPGWSSCDSSGSGSGCSDGASHSGSTGGVGSTNGLGGGATAAFSIMPPYYVLAYIIKL